MEDFKNKFDSLQRKNSLSKNETISLQRTIGTTLYQNIITKRLRQKPMLKKSKNIKQNKSRVKETNYSSNLFSSQRN